MAPLLSATGVVVVPAFIDQRLARTLYATLLLRRHRGEGKQDDHVPTATSFWGDSTLDAFHLTVLPDVEQVVGGPLLPTYCYARIYAHGDTLHRHHDREACELVASVHLGHRGTAPPPICFATGHAVTQHPGDAVVFHGAAIDHWRDTFLGDNFGQIFMNFVRADGPHRGWALDRRLRAFPPGLVPHLATIVDTEGSELAILESFPFGEYEVRVLTVEHNLTPARGAIMRFLEARGYRRARSLGIDDGYVLGTSTPHRAWRSRAWARRPATS